MSLRCGRCEVGIFLFSMACYDGWKIKKIIHCEYKCFLCDVLIQSSSGRVKIFGKSAIDLTGLIESAIGENIDKYHKCGSELFICNDKCYKRIQRFEKTTKNLKGIKEETSRIYESINRRVKRQRADQVDENIDENITPLTTSKRASASKSLSFTTDSWILPPCACAAVLLSE